MKDVWESFSRSTFKLLLCLEVTQSVTKEMFTLGCSEELPKSLCGFEDKRLSLNYTQNF